MKTYKVLANQRHSIKAEISSYRVSLVLFTVENNPDGDNHLHSLPHSEVTGDRPCSNISAICTTLRYMEFNGLISEEGIRHSSITKTLLCTITLNTYLQKREEVMVGW